MYRKVNTSAGIFINPEHQKKFDRYGYIVLPVFSEDTIKSLRNLYDEVYFKTDNPRSNFNAVSNADKNDVIANESSKLLSASLDKIFEGYTNNGPTFFTKEKRHGELGAHQDATLVDTQKYFSCYAWTPLQDVTIENGCIYVIDRSHLFFNNFVSFTYKNDEILANTISPQYITKVEMKAGEVLFFHTRLFHGSYPNLTDNTRVAINTLITPKETPLVYYQMKDQDTASEYFVSASSYRNSYNSYSKGLLPEGAIFSRNIKYKHIAINSKLLEKACSSQYTCGRVFFDRIKDLLTSG